MNIDSLQQPAGGPSPDVPARRQPAEGGPGGDGGPINILIVDDEPKNLTVLETVLNDPAYRLVRAESADEALLALVVEEFALLILDIRMPGMSGLELAGLIKERKKTAEVPIIFLTAYYNEDQHVLEGYGTGAVDYLHKPVNSAILRSKVAVFAELYRRSRECGTANRALLAEVAVRRRAEDELRELTETLEQRVIQRSEALRAGEERYRMLFDSAPMAIVVCDRSAVIQHYNSRAAELWGRDPARGSEKYRGSWADQESSPVEMVMRTGIPLNGLEYAIDRPDGSTITALASFVALKDARGEVVGAVSSFFDISERKNLEAMLREQTVELSDLHRRKDEFLAMLGHELRNPLAAITHAVQILDIQQVDEAQGQNEALAIIQRQLNQLQHLVDDLLEVSRFTTGRIQLRRGPALLGEIVSRAVESIRPLIDQRRHELVVSLPEKTVCLYADAARLQQVVVNLLANAAKFMDDAGEIALTVQEEGDVAVLRVRDHGIGISAEALPHIFDLFTQANQSIDRAQGGLGIGLSLVKRLVEMHEGRVDVQSSPGKGSEFVVRLPVLRGFPQLTPAAIEAGNSGGQSLRVLVVDDGRDVTHSMSILLQRLGHEVRTAADGPAALQTANQFHPDVVLLDIGLPGMDGLEVARRIRQQPTIQDALLVALTGYGLEADFQRSRAAGFDHHLVKPADIRKIRQILSTVIPRRKPIAGTAR